MVHVYVCVCVCSMCCGVACQWYGCWFLFGSGSGNYTASAAVISIIAHIIAFHPNIQQKQQQQQQLKHRNKKYYNMHSNLLVFTFCCCCFSNNMHIAYIIHFNHNKCSHIHVHLWICIYIYISTIITDIIIISCYYRIYIYDYMICKNMYETMCEHADGQ